MGALSPLLVLVGIALATSPALAAAGSRSLSGSASAGDFLVAQAAEHKGDWTLAGKLLTRSWQQSHDVATLREAFLISLGAGDIGEALTLAPAIRLDMPEAGVATALQAADAIRRGDAQAARRLVTDLPDKGIGAPLKTMLAAWADAGQGNRAAALQTLDRLKDFNSYRMLHAALIEEYLGGQTGKGRGDRTIADAAYAALDQGGPVPRVASVMSDYYRRTGRPGLASAALARMNTEPGEIAAISVRAANSPVRPSPTVASGAAEAFYDIGELLLEADHPDVALFYAEIARTLDPAKPDTHLLIGEIEQAEGRHVQAAADFLAVPEKSDFGLLSRLDAVLALDDSGDAKLALVTAQQLAKEHGSVAEPAIELGDLQRRHGRFEAAIPAYNQALQAMKPDDPRRAAVIFARGIAYDSLRNDAAAQADLKQAATLAPDKATILNYLGYYWASRGENLEAAQVMLQHAWELAPTDGAIADSLGWAMYQRGDYAGAVARLEDAVQLAPGDSEINGHLGDAYWQAGRHNDARFQWRHALLNAPAGTAPILKVKLMEGVGPALAKPAGESHAEVEIRN